MPVQQPRDGQGKPPSHGQARRPDPSLNRGMPAYGNVPARTTAPVQGTARNGRKNIAGTGVNGADNQRQKTSGAQRTPHSVDNWQEGYAGIGSNVPVRMSGAETFASGRTDIVSMALIILNALLVICILTVLVMIIYDFAHRSRVVSVNPGILLLEIAIYALCVLSGYLWGRYQVYTRIMQENRHLSVAIEEKDRELTELHKWARQLEQERETPRREIVREHNQPRPTLYDESNDPVGYEQEREQHPHEKADYRMLRNGWNVLAGSRRGYGHAYDGKYREDDFALRVVEAGLANGLAVVVAIADGVGSKQYSRWGASAAVQGAVRVNDALLSRLVKQVQQYFYNDVTMKNVCEETIGGILLQSFESAYANIQRCAQESNVPIDQLHATLLVFCAVFVDAEHMFVGSVQIGDGALFAYQQGADGAMPGAWQYLQAPQIKGGGNEVQAFIQSTREEWPQYLRYDWLRQPTFIMGMTDGVADDLESFDEGRDPFVNVDDFQHAVMQEAIGQADVPAAFIKFLGYKKKQSSDDRTVVCLYRAPGA